MQVGRIVKGLCPAGTIANLNSVLVCIAGELLTLVPF